MPDALPRVERFLSSLQEQALFKDKNTQGSVLWYIDFYQSRAPKKRWAFRASGFILLFLSISLPFTTQVVPKDWQPQAASTLSWLIAIVASANSFFNWQKAWQLYTQTQLTLQFALSEWEVRTAEAYAAANDDEGLKILRLALERITNIVSESIANETAQYFEGVQVPNVKLSKD